MMPLRISSAISLATGKRISSARSLTIITSGILTSFFSLGVRLSPSLPRISWISEKVARKASRFCWCFQAATIFGTSLSSILIALKPTSKPKLGSFSNNSWVVTFNCLATELTFIALFWV